MSTIAESGGENVCCASCGIDGGEDTKLMKCTACYLVRYCSVKCQKEHRPKHKRECKKRAAELRDELLFKQPESSYLGDCPICMVPLPLDIQKSSMQSCCSKVVCCGCDYANKKREEEMRLVQSCPFCRKALPRTKEEGDKLRMKRIEANDPFAICQLGVEQFEKGDNKRAFEYWTKAAKLGDADAHCRLALLYQLGERFEKGNEIHHLEEATIGGHPTARYMLACCEHNNGNIRRAVKHWIIAASQGDEDSIKELMDMFKIGFLEKDVLAATLRAQKAAVEATKSPQRQAAEEWKVKRNRLE